ncbi:hypothetical protein [Listeria seeligeri]|uniref:hypothetical protein n=1 Tax=Listeria seeligeri TaxID=1640 RepID=UPI001626475F|nr:hypothetical protein [Listeria seeligeri]EGQ5594058.1 hypothetical protein [Listeria monocytogenes]MBC1730248.1 hypothetical protein [Listeria seeligeri]MBC2232261.1 hypothetical protein [Listeria seeligeri]MBF2626240.1 hypothetical protein [Listeria seeligeri]
MKIQLITTSSTEFTVEVSESNYENCIDSFIRGFEDEEVKAITFIDEDSTLIIPISNVVSVRIFRNEVTE